MTKYRLHETPVDIAECLSKAAPHNARNILEPSVGNGSLVDAVCKQIPDFNQIVCIDIDEKITRSLKNEYKSSLKDRLKIINADFLKWSSRQDKKQYKDYFDLIIMNPPFVAKTDNWVNVSWNYDQFIPNKSPLEVAFIINSIPLLKDNGILLSILPTSVISSKQLKWFRKALMSFGRIVSVHELPEFSFPGIESKIYLFVFKKGCGHPYVILKNHSLKSPDTLKLYKNGLNEDLRLDYSFYEGKSLIEKVKINYGNLEWDMLAKIAKVIRGGEESPEGTSRAVHSTEYKEGFWHFDDNKDYKLNDKSNIIEEGDILCKRVGRHCSESFGLSLDLNGHNCSDCVFIIKPNDRTNTNQILFTLRVLFCNEEGKKYLERGTGAKYLSAKDLRRCYIPLNLLEVFNKEYDAYEAAINDIDFFKMKSIEEKVFKSLKINFK